MKTFIHQMLANQKLSYTEAKNLIFDLAENKFNHAQSAALLSAFVMRGVEIEELRGFRDALLSLAVKPDISTQDCIDLCGTGGDEKNTFNISTLAAFVVAGAGGRVIKHGNYGVSSVSGSSSVLAYLGHEFSTDAAKLQKSLDKSGICFLHAPLFHLSVKNAAIVRKEIGVKTFFNMLGPMINPVEPPFRLTGVFNLQLARLYKYLYEKEPINFFIVHSTDGYDELSLTAPAKVLGAKTGFMLSPTDFGVKKNNPEELFGGNTVAEAADIFLDVLQNSASTAKKNAVLANAALALHCLRPDKALEDCFAEAQESLVSGRAFRSFQIFMEN